MKTIQDTVVAIREKEMLIERYRTSIESIDKYINKYDNYKDVHRALLSKPES